MPDTNTDLTTTQVAAAFGVSPRTITRWAESKDLPSRKIPTGPHGAYLFERADVDEFARQLRQLAAAPPADTLPGLDVADVDELPAGCDAR
jgi:excisionase family DNA binding protein